MYPRITRKDSNHSIQNYKNHDIIERICVCVGVLLGGKWGDPERKYPIKGQPLPRINPMRDTWLRHPFTVRLSIKLFLQQTLHITQRVWTGVLWIGEKSR